MTEIEIEIDDDRPGRRLLTGVRLPDGSASGGFLIRRGADRILVLFADEDVRVGDRVTVARDVELTVTRVQRGTYTGQPVTAIDVRPPRTTG